MHCYRRDFVVWMSDLCSMCPLMGLYEIQTKEIKYRQLLPSPCLFAESEAVSKHSVSLWIGYSDTIDKKSVSCVPQTETIHTHFIQRFLRKLGTTYNVHVKENTNILSLRVKINHNPKNLIACGFFFPRRMNKMNPLPPLVSILPQWSGLQKFLLCYPFFRIFSPVPLTLSFFLAKAR